MPDGPSTGGPAFANRLVRLSADGGPTMVGPADPTTDPYAFEPFPLPRLTLSAVGWCKAAVAQFWEHHKASLAVVLLLDLQLRRWVPLLPTQRCGRRTLLWDLIQTDYAHLPAHLLIAGSFQSLGPGDVFAAHRAVPAFDGVHVVEQRAGGRRSRRSWLFLRSDGGQAELLADPAAILTDDVQAALREAADRLRVEPDK